MTTFGSMFRERIKQFFIRETFPTEARGVRRDLELVRKDEEKLAQAEASGEVSNVIKDEKRIDKDLAKEAKSLFNLLRNIRLVTQTQLMWLVIIRREVNDDKDLSAEEKRQVLEAIAEYRKRLAAIVNKLFQGETSLESINTSMKGILEIESLGNDLFFSTFMAGRAERRTTRDEKRIAGKARQRGWIKSPAAKRYMKRFEADFTKEMKNLTTEATDILNLLRRESQTLKSQLQHVQKLVSEEGFPTNIGNEIEDLYKKEIEAFHRRLQEEIAKKRIEDSAFEQAA